MKTLGFFIAFAFLLISAYGQNCSCYIIKGDIDFRSKKFKKKDLIAHLSVSVLQKNNERRNLPVILVETRDGSLSFGPKSFPRHPGDSLVFITITTNLQNELAAPEWYCESQEFSNDGGFYDRPPNRIKLPVTDNNDRGAMLLTAQNYKGKNPFVAINYYKRIDSTELDRNDAQKYITNIELASVYQKIKDYTSQYAVFYDMSKRININELSAELQKRYWEENYDNKLLLQGIDTLTKQEKIKFNDNFGNLAFTNASFLDKWKPFVLEIKNSELGKLKLKYLDVTSFDTPEQITLQKKIIGSALGREEINK